MVLRIEINFKEKFSHLIVCLVPDLEGSEDEGGGWSEPGGGSSGGSYGGSGGGLGGANASNAVNATVVITNRPTMSLLSSFRQTWKPRHNHFVRHTDVKPKDERRLTVNEIANQKMALQRVNGWKVSGVGGNSWHLCCHDFKEIEEVLRD